MMAETWSAVVGFEDLYEVSDHGRVRSLDRVTVHTDGRVRRYEGRELSAQANKRGHQYVRLYREGRGVKAYLHRMVLEAFVGTAPEGTEGCHRDDDPSNNRLDNLRWDTHSENLLEATRNGRNHHANKTHCKRGHAYAGDNLVLDGGRRRCRTCIRALRVERDAVRRLWAAQASLDQAEADGDPYEITRAQNALLEADIEYSAALGAALA